VGRLSELFCVVLCTAVMCSHINSSFVRTRDFGFKFML